MTSEVTDFRENEQYLYDFIPHFYREDDLSRLMQLNAFLELSVKPIFFIDPKTLAKKFIL